MNEKTLQLQRSASEPIGADLNRLQRLHVLNLTHNVFVEGVSAGFEFSQRRTVFHAQCTVAFGETTPSNLHALQRVHSNQPQRIHALEAPLANHDPPQRTQVNGQRLHTHEAVVADRQTLQRVQSSQLQRLHITATVVPKRQSLQPREPGQVNRGECVVVQAALVHHDFVYRRRERVEVGS